MPNPHANTPLLTAGPSPETSPATLLMLHGRGGSAQDILSLAPLFDLPTLAALAPQAANHTWYPLSFLAPIQQNQPDLDSALARIDSIVTDLLSRNIPSDRIALLGFSQGACLTSEYVARNPRHYGAVMILSGGVIGPPGTPRNYTGSLANTPVLLACSDPDPHIPFSRVRETESIFTRMGARVDLRRYPDEPHSINQDQVEACRALLNPLAAK